MNLELTNITKRFGRVAAVDNISLQVRAGDVFGFMGSNGAGKTTTIRMILDILQPDSGEICWKGRDVRQVDRSCFGYLPEERGLYPKMPVMDQLLYLTQLHGNHRPKDAKQNIGQWLQRLDLVAHKGTPVEKLSKGNQQKVQFIAAVAHRPELVILDEPFSGLDPVNAQVLQQSLSYLSEQGTTLLFSSHRLEHVEHLCNRVALIHRARIALQGSIQEAKQWAGVKTVRLATPNPLDFVESLPGASIEGRTGEMTELQIQDGLNPQDILRMALQQGQVTHFELREPSLEDVYLKVVGE